MTSKLSSASSYLRESKREYDDSVEKGAVKASAASQGRLDDVGHFDRKHTLRRARERLRKEVREGQAGIRKSELSPEEKKQKSTELTNRAKSIEEEMLNMVKDPASRFSGGGRVRGMGAATRGGNFSRNG
tara:strand:+ start:2069 stop:2458 length:390 start_codon:yes stop_codon:yes gene_type:complete